MHRHGTFRGPSFTHFRVPVTWCANNAYNEHDLATQHRVA